MEFWTHLGIEKTKDTEAITAAYHKKLPLVNPEDKPEEFKALRSEYEEALRYAKQEEQPEGELSPAEQWVSRVNDIYMSIADRCDPGKWQELLSDPLCESLDARSDILEKLLVYLMDHWRLPQEIWKLLDGNFDLRSRRDELIEKFPKDFIDNAVIGGIEDEPHVRYEWFLPLNSGDVDAFFPLYFKARDELMNNDLDNAKATLEELDSTGILHPFGELLHLRYEFLSAEGPVAPDNVLERCGELYVAHPENTEIAGFYADLLSTREERADSIPIYDRILEAEPNNQNMRYHKAQTLMEMGDYKAAKDLFLELNEAIPFNSSIRSGMIEANKRLMERYERALHENPDDFETRLEYAWCLFQNDEDQKALELMDFPAPDDLAMRCDYENLLTKLSHSTGDHEGCLSHAALWRAFVEKLPEGQTKDEKRRKNKRGDIAVMECVSLYDLKRYEEALSKADEAIAADPDEYRAYHERYLCCVALQEYDEAVKTCEKMVEIKPIAIAYHLLGRAYYYQGNMQASFDSFGRALEIDKDASSYIFRARILIMYDEYDDAKEILDLLKDNGIYDENVKYCESLILMEKDDKEDEAKALWQEILDADANGEDFCYFLYETCNDMAIWMIRHESDPEEILGVIDRGLEDRGDYAPLLMNKGYILDEHLNRHEEGLACYRKVYEKYPRHTTVCEKMGAIYYYDLNDAATALSFFKEQERRSDSAYCQTMLGNCCSALELFDEAETHFQNALQLAPDSERVLRDYVSMLMRSRRYEVALTYARKIADIAGDRSPYAKRKLAQVLARLGRYEEASDIHMALYGKFNHTEDIDSAADMLIDGGLPEKYLALLRQYRKELGDAYHWHMIRYSMAVGDDSLWLSSIRSISEDNRDLQRHFAYYYYHHGDYKKALSCIEQYYEANPDSIMQRHLPVRCRRLLGMKDGIDDAFERGMNILSAEKSHCYKPMFLTKMALMYLAMGMTNEAKKCIDDAFASPLCDQCAYCGCIDGYDALSEYYEVTGDYDNAVLACLEGQKYAPFDCDFGVRLRRLRKDHKKELRKDLQQ